MKDEFSLWRIPDFRGMEFLKAISIHHSYPRHWHDTYVIEVVEEGVNGFSCAGSTYSAPAGSIIVINPGEVHTGFSAGSTPLVYRSVYPESAVLSERRPAFRYPVIFDSQLATSLRQAHRCAEAADDLLLTESLLSTVFSELVARYGGKPLLSEPAHPAPVRAAREFIADNYQKQIRLETLAGLCGLSVFHFLRAFRKAVGMPPFEFLTNVRIERAKELLRKGQPISEVAQCAGFYDQSHLHKYFKRIVGVTPGKYRARSYNTVTRSLS